jgi:CHAT domain-containing protein
MTICALGVFADTQLQQLVNRAMHGKGKVEFVASDASTALESGIIQDASDTADTILILDAQMPQGPAFRPDQHEKAALGLLQDLRRQGVDMPALVITPFANAASELAEYCNPNNRALLLPQKHLKAPIFHHVIAMLCDGRGASEPNWDVIEIEVTHQTSRCLVGGRGGKLIEWGESSTVNRLAKRLSLEYIKPDFRQGWARRIHSDGTLLFNELVISSLGRGFFSYLEQAAGGLRKLAFRFCVDDAALYSAPYEAAVRESEKPLNGNDNDFTEHPFVLVNAPIARRIKSINVRTCPAQAAVPHPTRLLFIRSQVGENPADETDSDTLQVEEVDQADGRTRIKHVEFRKLENIDLELENLSKLEALEHSTFSMEILDLSKNLDTGGARAALMAKLSESFDVVHFAGHSFTTKGARTMLVLPSERPGEAEGLDVQTFAEGVAASGARLVYLSSCQGSSANTVASLGQRGVPHVVGFRWDVEDDRAAEFARSFYEDLFTAGTGTISGAFRAACSSVYQPERIEASPIWASPILASRSDDWVAQRVLEQ